MKSSGGRSNWSFNFLGKRHSRPESTSRFYCDEIVDSNDEPIVRSVSSSQGLALTQRNAKLSHNNDNYGVDILHSLSNECDLEDSDDLVTFCCGLRKLPSKSISFNNHPNPVGLSETTHKCEGSVGDLELQIIDEAYHENTMVSMRNKPKYNDSDNNDSDEVKLVSCKKNSLYPRWSIDESLEIHAIEDMIPDQSKDMVSIINERRKLFETSQIDPSTNRNPLRSKPADSIAKVKGHAFNNFRNSFTTEDVDIFMKTPSLSKRRLVQNPSIPPKPRPPPTLLGGMKDNLNILDFNRNSNSLKDISNSCQAYDDKILTRDLNKVSPTTTINTSQKHHVSANISPTNLLPRKPQIPPKSEKLISFVHSQSAQQINEAITKGESSCYPHGSGHAPHDPCGQPKDLLSESDSDSCEDSDVDDTFASETIQSENFESKAQKVARELLESEVVYVKKLYLIDQIFHMEIIRRNRQERFIPDDIIPQVFSNIKCIYQFHNDYLLPELKSCLDKWEEGPRVGMVMRKAAPFFKLYTEFVTNFSNATNIINATINKSDKFALLIDELQKHPDCGSLSLQHHLLEPIQRVPRYQMLLAEYLKRLPDDSPDKSPTEVALKLVTEAARHTNDEMRKMEKFKKLLDTCAMLVHHKDENLISINRELIKEGKIKKISARDGSLLDRYLYLFNDTLLVCMGLPLKIGFGQQYFVKSKLDICGMKIYEGNNDEHSNSFIIMSKQKSIEFTASSSDEKNEWVSELWSVIKHFIGKERTKDKEFLSKMYLPTEQLGKRAPTWVKDQETSMCMLCSIDFKTFRRRHHCRACGKVICNECSTHKLKMDFDLDKLNRVCDLCYGILESSESTARSTKIARRHKGPSVLGLKATSKDMVLCGYLNSSLDNKTWMRRWLVLHSNCALYIFKAKRDNAAIDSLPMPGYRVEECKSDEINTKNTSVFKVFHDQIPKVYYFSTTDKALFKSWIEKLKLAIVAELPSSPVIGSPSMPLATPSVFQANEMQLIEEIQNKETEYNSQSLNNINILIK